MLANKGWMISVTIWAAFFAINTGMLCIVVDHLLKTSTLTALGSAAELLALLAFALGNWRRIKPFES